MSNFDHKNGPLRLERDAEFPRCIDARGRNKSAALRTSAAATILASCHTILANRNGSRSPELRPFLSERLCEMSDLETYREKALECVRAADEVHDSGERVELLGLASVYMALADYVDRVHVHDTAHHAGEDQG